MKVLVVGGGLAGCGVAHKLLQHQVEVVVAERDESSQSRHQGLTIGITQQAIDVLYECQVEFEDLLTERGATGLSLMPYLRVHGLMTVKIRNGLVRSCLVDRGLLRWRMLQSLTKYNKNCRVEFGKRFIKYVESDSGVTAHFDDGTQIHAEVLLGCDGANSLVRAQRCPSLTPSDMHYFTCAGTIDISAHVYQQLKNNAVFKESMTCLVRKAGKLGASWLSFVDGSTAGQHGRLLWSLSMPDSTAQLYKLQQAGDDLPALKERSAALAKDLFTADELVLIELTPDDKMFKGYQIMSVYQKVLKTNPLSAEKQSRVSLLGDAAHKTTTHAGQGATAALVDAKLCADSLLVANAGVHKALRAYEAEMTTNAVKVVSASVASTLRIHNQSKLALWISTPIMYTVGFLLRVYYWIKPPRQYLQVHPDHDRE